MVSIPDAGLRSAVEQAMGIDAGADILSCDLALLTVLNAEARGIKSLAGLEPATGLINLYLYTNQITDLTPLSKLTALEELILGDNQISDIGPLVLNPGMNAGDTLWLSPNSSSTVSADMGRLRSNKNKDLARISHQGG